MRYTLSNVDSFVYGSDPGSPCDRCNCLVLCDYMNSPDCTDIYLGHANFDNQLKHYVKLFMKCVEDYKRNRYKVFPFDLTKQSKENEKARETIEKLFFYLKSRLERSK